MSHWGSDPFYLIQFTYRTPDRSSNRSLSPNPEPLPPQLIRSQILRDQFKMEFGVVLGLQIWKNHTRKLYLSDGEKVRNFSPKEGNIK